MSRPRRRGATPRAAAAEAARRAARPLIRLRQDLPVVARREEFATLLGAHQVVIVAGETGSGKSTQLAQICLELGRGVTGLIAHTQPRRLAARALAARIAEEMQQPVGRTVGYRVRFADAVADETRLVLLTDGLLLAELAGDRRLERYDTILIDEAHERSLNVDLLLGVLRGLLAERADLKVIVMSATMDVERISGFFGGAPVLTVGGRAHPVELRYQEPAAGEEEPDLPAAVLEAFRGIEADPGAAGPGDTLVFLPGEREIAEVAETLERELAGEVEILPLYSRLSWERQSRVFSPGPRRRIVLATNVAETSVTVPRIRAVIDAGLARISRYSVRNRLQRLPIEKISRASAEQRKGRCGRLGPGVCVRLYSQEDFEARPAFTEPEILRTNLAALLLRLAADGLGPAESFPFVDPPESRALGDGYRLLQELGALDADRGITRNGRQMARLPLDPRLARALIESRRFGAEAEVCAIAAGLSVADVRSGESPESDPEGERFGDGKSQFMELLAIWRGYRRARGGTRGALRRWCRERRLSAFRLGEWEDVHAQLISRAAEAGIDSRAGNASYAAIHRSLLAGFATMVGLRGEEGVYAGPRGVRFRLFPGSGPARRRPRWVMATSIVETSRIYARGVAEIDPSWIETAAAHLIKIDHLEPDWDESREEVVARRVSSLYGLVIAHRRVNYGPVAPEQARRIFAREALVHGRLGRRPPWLLANDRALAEARRVEDRLRMRGLVIEAEGLVDFYDQRLPRQVSSTATLEHFLRRLEQGQLRTLALDEHSLFIRPPDPAVLAALPTVVRVAGLQVPVDYRFEPGSEADGATLRLPAVALPLASQAELSAAIPALVRPRIEALLRSLPKELRRGLIPIPATAGRFLEELGPRAADRRSLAAWLQRRAAIPPGEVRFELPEPDAHLEPQIEVVEDGRPLARGRDLARLRAAAAARARATLEDAAALAHPEPWRRFELEELADTERITIAARSEGDAWGAIELPVALAEGPDGVRVRYAWSAEEAAILHRQGAIRLAADLLQAEARSAGRRIAADARLVLAASAFVSGEILLDRLWRAAVREACFDDGPAPRRRSEFAAAIERGRAGLQAALESRTAQAAGWFAQARAIRRLLEPLRRGPLRSQVSEEDEHLARLLEDGLADPPSPWLLRIDRYLRAAERRWQRLGQRGQEPDQASEALLPFDRRLESLRARALAEDRHPAALDEFRWWLEEFRISLYAQELRTLGPVSAARLEARAAEIEAWFRR
ncbi:MAG: ATP-dependent RNA helicase HrpA [Gammaproteobacteria bacterium]|nr:ATP-dependent RNA helicase HrpA [Gammaproteobacteria bacterium]